MSKKRLTWKQWNDSQKNEAHFWNVQKNLGNEEQKRRNQYCRGIIEDNCNICKDFFAQDFSKLKIIDIGSGPEGILHVINAACKVALDPLMDEYEKMGYAIDANGVLPYSAMAEHAAFGRISYDCAICMNALDHMKNPQIAIQSIAEILRDGGQLLLTTDLRTDQQLDCYHKLPLKQIEVESYLAQYFTIHRSANIAHQAGNPVRQFIAWCIKTNG